MQTKKRTNTISKLIAQKKKKKGGKKWMKCIDESEFEGLKGHNSKLRDDSGTQKKKKKIDGWR